MLSENAFKEMPTLANRWSNFRFSSGIQVYFWMQRVYPKDRTYRRDADGKEVKRGGKFYEAAGHVLNALVAGSTTLVSDLSLSLADNASAGELKNRQEQVSGWLQRYDFEEGLNDFLMARAKPLVGPTTALAVDFSDISKAFGGKGMEEIGRAHV